MHANSGEIIFLMLVFALMVVPRMLQRFRIPAPISSFALGLVATLSALNLHQSGTLALLAILGISSLFLFAGLEVDLDDFKRGALPLVRHVILRAFMLALITGLLMRFFDFSWQVSTLIALATLTPSAGFILDTLHSLDFTEEERYWIRMKAISGELFALVVLFVVLQSGSMESLGRSSAALIAMIVGLPMIFIILG